MGLLSLQLLLSLEVNLSVLSVVSFYLNLAEVGRPQLA